MQGAPGERRSTQHGNGQAGQAHPDPAVEMLIRAGMVLATSLHDPHTTMREVADLLVPSLGDMCVIDLLGEDGTIKDVAVAATEPRLEQGLEHMRSRFPLSHEGEHPVAAVIRSGQPMLLEQMDRGALRAFAESSIHAEFMINNGYRSAVVAPLVARDRTLGAISVLRFGEGEPYRQEDLDLVQAFAWRAALAIDNSRLFSDLRVLEERMEAVLASLTEAITVEDSEGRLVFANQAAAELLGADSPEQLTGAPKGTFRSRYRWLDEQGCELSLQDMPGMRLFAGEHPDPLLMRSVARNTGEERWLVLRCTPVRDPEGGGVLYAVNAFENVTDIKRAQLAGHFLADASRALASSLDYGPTLRRVAELAVPQVADWCAVDVVGESGEIERVAVHHPDPAKLRVAQRLADEYPLDLSKDTGMARVLREGSSLLASEIEAGALAAHARDAEHLRLLGEIGMHSVIVVPMVAAAAKVTGAITLATAESGRRLGEQELELAEELGRRAGVAVENARLYTERTRIALTLQQALLPESLPLIPGVELDALYTAAGELNEVGGDFYDVFSYGERRWMLVIGDVCGKGPRAASVTALARYTLRAAAMSGQSPVEMLNTLHRALMGGNEPAEMCTVCLVTLARETLGASVTVTLAGHPPPLLIDGDGEIEQLGRIGTLLGAIEPLKLQETHVRIGEGDTVLLYTDGAIDAGSGGDVLGEQGLLEVCAAAADNKGGLSQLLSGVERAALRCSRGSLRDDLALLAVRLGPSKPVPGEVAANPTAEAANANPAAEATTANPTAEAANANPTAEATNANPTAEGAIRTGSAARS